MLPELTALVDHQLLAVLLLGLALKFRVDLARQRVGAERSAEKEDVGLGSVARIVLPPAALLHPQSAPLNVGQGAVLGQRLGRLLRKNNMSVLELAVLVLLRVFNL